MNKAMGQSAVTAIRENAGKSIAALALVLVLSGCTGILSGTEKREAAVSTPGLETMYRVARAMEKSGDYEGAEESFSRIVSKYPGRAEGYTGMGFVQLKMGKVFVAERSFEKARQINGQAPEAIVGLALIDMERKEYENARTKLGPVLAASPNNKRALVAMGVALDALRDHGQAREHYQRVLALDGANIAAQNNLALSFALDGNLGRGISILDEIAASRDAPEKIRLNLSILRALSGDEELAKKTAESLIDKSEAAKNIIRLRHARTRFKKQNS